MCLILFALRAHASYPLILAANRDEAYSRPSAPAAFWHDRSDIYGGRDLEHGGTWLGLTTAGRLAAITNYRQGHRSDDMGSSRGELTRGFLNTATESAAYMQQVEASAHRYHGFSLIAGDVEELWFYSNRGGASYEIAPGIHGLSNHLLDEPWPKVQKGVKVLGGLLHAEETALTTTLFELLGDRAAAPDESLPATGIGFERERALSASFIAGESYGTRASTVILVKNDGEVLYCERGFGPAGLATGATDRRFRLQRRVTAHSQAAARA